MDKQKIRFESRNRVQPDRQNFHSSNFLKTQALVARNLNSWIDHKVHIETVKTCKYTQLLIHPIDYNRGQSNFAFAARISQDLSTHGEIELQ